MKGLILLANYFEDVEALITIDMLRRAKIKIDLISLNNSKKVITQSNIVIEGDYLYSEINFDDYDFLIIPGGKATYETHLTSKFTKKAVDHFMKKRQLIASICAAPSILGIYGYLDNKPFTCFPGCEDKIKNGIYMPNKDVVVVENIITSKACGTTFDFAYEIIKYLSNEVQSQKLIDSVYYKRSK